MRERFLRLWILACVAMSLCACGGRSAARVSEIESTRVVNDSTSISRWEMEYDSDGYLSTMEFFRDGALERTTRFDYDEGRLLELETTQASGQVSSIELDWRDGQVREMEYTEDGDRWVKTFTYNAENPTRLQKSEMERPYGLGTTLRITESYTWNEEGQLEEHVRESRTRTDLLDLEVVTTETSERRFAKSGELDRLTVYLATGGNTDVEQWSYAYASGRLDEIDTDTDKNYRIDYEDGRMVELDYRGDGGRVITELKYENGSIAGDLRWSPPNLPGALHFDVAGTSFPDFSLIAPRFLLGAP